MFKDLWNRFARAATPETPEDIHADWSDEVKAEDRPACDCCGSSSSSSGVAGVNVVHINGVATMIVTLPEWAHVTSDDVLRIEDEFKRKFKATAIDVASVIVVSHGTQISFVVKPAV